MTELPPSIEPDILPPEPEEPLPIHHVPPPRSYKKILLVVLGVLAGLSLIGIIYRTISQMTPPNPSPSPQASSESSPTVDVGTKNLLLGSLSISYPDDWFILFSPIIDAKTPSLTPLYFVRSETEYREQASCASTGSCTLAPLSVEFSGATAIWPGYSLSDFIKTSTPDFPIDKLTETTYAQHAGLGGYTDLSKLTYQALIRTDDTTFRSITIKGREDTREMLTAFVEYLNRAHVLTSNPSQKFAYTLKLSARLKTGEYPILSLILDNLFAPKASDSQPTYTLFTEGAGAYPTNYLDSTYQLLTDNPELKPGEYLSSQITATISEAPKDDFIPYLEDSKYCRENTDCVYRANFCTFGAYNRYHEFATPWGCGPVEYTGLGNSLELEDSLKCRDGLDITYDSLECVENKCVVHNPVPICKEDR